MWAVLDENSKVTLVIFPDCPQEKFNEIKKENNDRIVKMTIENSPAWVNGYYKNNVFYPPVDYPETERV